MVVVRILVGKVVVLLKGVEEWKVVVLLKRVEEWKAVDFHPFDITE